MKLGGWGNFPVIESEQYVPSTITDLERHLGSGDGFNGIVRGMGRSYGDSSLAEHTISSLNLSHILAFEEDTGVVTCSAGVTLADLLDVFVPRGWFLSVTPGTKYITVGGAIASDVHGKNHHLSGCFSECLVEIKLLLANGEIIRCSRSENVEIFRATCGGMGLTGIITEARFQLKAIESSYINETTLKADNLEEIIELFDEHSSATYSVAWFDCLARGKRLGRSLLMLGEHSKDGELDSYRKRQLSVPVNLPGFVLNHYSVSAFNSVYFNKVLKKRSYKRVHYEPFFYPLDSIGSWNRVYGKNGFTQYQFVIPKEAGVKGFKVILKKISESRLGSFLAVLKVFGKENDNYLSFPIEGYTLALDFKIEKKLFPLLDELDRLVVEYGGRVYLTKDARLSEETFKHSYPDWEEFCRVRHECGADKMFYSLQSKRLGI